MRWQLKFLQVSSTKTPFKSLHKLIFHPHLIWSSFILHTKTLQKSMNKSRMNEQEPTNSLKLIHHMEVFFILCLTSAGEMLKGTSQRKINFISAFCCCCFHHFQLKHESISWCRQLAELNSFKSASRNF